VLAGTFAAALLAVAPGRAHAGGPFWSDRQAADKVLLGEIDIGGRAIRLADVACMGTGPLRIKSGKTYKYQHFNCLLTPARERRFWIRVHTLKGGVFTYNFLRWN
jgi:hypothetical protein